MTEEELEAIAGGYHGDAFSVLGPHAAQDGAKALTGAKALSGAKALTGALTKDAEVGWEIRAFLPLAKELEVLLDDPDKTTLPMKRVHAAGIFDVGLKSKPGNYRFRLTGFDGGCYEMEDPYRFPIVISSFDLHLFLEGTNYEVYNALGAHLARVEGVEGTRFAVWAPNALVVSLVGDFNGWDTRQNPMRLREGGVWELFMPGIGPGISYKFNVKSRLRGYSQQKADPYAFWTETPPKSASIVADLDTYEWSDHEWLANRAKAHILDSPAAFYEVHAGSWRKDEHGNPLTYRQLAATLVPYVKELGYTHIELMPIAEHPFTPSWGYQVTGYFAPTSRFGTPQDFMYFVDCCHQAGIGLVVDWVPAHFPKDAHGLAYFDGTALYEHEDPRLGEHKDWGTLIFNFGRNEVKSFLISNALFWLKKYHIDGLRVDAVASILYLDYSRKAGEWYPNRYGGNENLEAIDFLRKFNELAHTVPGAITIAEESTAFTGVSRPVYANGLGFTMKWNMGWMHDMLDYFAKDPVHRKYHQNAITFSMVYAFTENFVLPISHDEVVYGKRALLDKMPGDEWQRFANTRAFLTYMYGHPGKKLLFMGSEIGQTAEWNSETDVQWWLLDFEIHRKLKVFCAALNSLYKSEPAMYEIDFQWWGFEWIDFHDTDNSIISFVRRAKRREDFLVFVCNFTPTPHPAYRVGLPEAGGYREIFNSDSAMFGGSDMGNGGWVHAEPTESHFRPASASLIIPPLGVVVLKPARPLPEIIEVEPMQIAVA